MKFRRNISILCIIGLLSLLWLWRYASLNNYYRSLTDKSREIYQIGDIVAFEDDYLAKDMSVDGYYLKVENFEIFNFSEYSEMVDFSTNDFEITPDKIALVYITLFNENSNAEGVMLTELKLHGIDNYAGMNWEILLAANPGLKGNYGIRLSPGTEYSLIIPFDLNSTYYEKNTWENIDQYNFYFRITSFPTEKDIQVQ